MKFDRKKRGLAVGTLKSCPAAVYSRISDESRHQKHGSKAQSDPDYLGHGLGHATLIHSPELLAMPIVLTMRLFLTIWTAALPNGSIEALQRLYADHLPAAFQWVFPSHVASRTCLIVARDGIFANS